MRKGVLISIFVFSLLAHFSLVSAKYPNQGTMMQRRETFKEKLSEIQDTRKQATVERVNNTLANINARRTNNWTQVLEVFTNILNKVEEKKDKLASEGKDVSGVETAIVDARTAIENAETAVSNQAAETYIIDIQNEETLKDSVTEAKNQLKSDLKEIRDIVSEAKEVVRDAIHALNEARAADE